ncbi:hypothetical protein [Brevibacterium oceani]|uniref:hypothetical protein n=1 Tax=Brevibacterium oceani TaxID=358099 RepID=UPI001B32625E|nr:hypothetical protein [Brevibacterium oceani]
MAQTDSTIPFDPHTVMDPRNLGAMQPTRLSASRSFMAKMIREKWTIERELFELDARGNGQIRYAVTTPGGPLTFIAFLQEPQGNNRTGRIIGTSWDMIGALLDGVATAEQVRATREEIPRLYEGRATPNTLVWFRSNQSLRIFREVRNALSEGRQPDAKELHKVGYLMRNTGLDGNGTFGTIPFVAIPDGHPLAASYHAQMLSAYLMRELSVDLVEELARIDSPSTAVRLDRDVKRILGVGNGSALGLAMLFYNRPILINSYISAYSDILAHILEDPAASTPEKLSLLEDHLNRTIRYRAFLTTSYRFFTSNMEIVADLRRIRAKVRAGVRGDINVADGKTVLGAIHSETAIQVSSEALHSFNALLMELDPDYCDEIARSRLTFDERLDLDPQMTLEEARSVIEGPFRWALEIPLNDEGNRDRVWYQSRAAEEPRSGPREEVPDAHELVQSYPDQVRALRDAIEEADDASTTTIGALVADRPELEYIARLVVALADKPYATAHADPHDTDFVPVWVIRFINSFIHGLDRTEDHMGRDVRGLIFEGAPYRDEIADADPATWWWSYSKPAAASGRSSAAQPPSPSAINTSTTAHGADASAQTVPGATVVLTPTQSPISPPCEHATETIGFKYREMRLMVGRAYQALNLPLGAWHGAREFFNTALVADLRTATAFGELLMRDVDSDRGQAGPWRAPSSEDGDDSLIIDNHGQSLLVTGHVLVNLLGAHADRRGRRFTIRNAQTDHALPGLRLELHRYGIELDIEATAGEAAGTVRLGDSPQIARQEYHTAMDEYFANGRTIEAEAFWKIYYRGNAGLDVDTPISRQHTGGTVLDVIRPGERITKQFTSEELHLLTDPDELDNQNLVHFIAVN